MNKSSEGLIGGIYSTIGWVAKSNSKNEFYLKSNHLLIKLTLLIWTQPID